MTQGPHRRIHDGVVFRVEYADHTPYGSALTGLCDTLIRKTCEAACVGVFEGHESDTPGRARAALERCFSASALGGLYEAPDRLQLACRYPEPSRVIPSALWIGRDDDTGRSQRVPVDPGRWADVGAWLQEWREPSVAPRDAFGRRLWDALSSVEGLTASIPARRLELDDGLTLVGHATVLWRAAGTSLLVDPFLLGADRGAQPGYRPHTRPELAADAILITHSHPDHFDVGALLGLGRDLPIVVPKVERESLLAVDMEARLLELGFSRVRTLAWGCRIEIGGLVVHAHPFHGEQPTDREVLHPEIRNVGCTYLVEGGGRRALFLADAGRDGLGAAIDAVPGPANGASAVDVVFGGYRGWRLYPPQYVTSSVARYLLFVPRAHWGTRMQLMNDARDLMAVAERGGARWVVPYANGGAPWYWLHGLGPDLRRPAPADKRDFDPDHDALADAATAADATLVVLHPGERMRWDDDDAVVRVTSPGFVWPFAEPQPRLRERVPTRMEADA